MNYNYASQSQGVVAWTGGATPVATPVDIRHHIGFAFTFQATADLAADTVFEVQAAPPSQADPCLPGTFVDVPETLACESGFGATPGPKSSIMLPNGTKKGSICTATLPCRPDAFVQLKAGSGDTAKVNAVVTLYGPR